MPLAGTLIVQREQTPTEARETMEREKREWSDNNYHSAILRSEENQRWVTAMDVAIGQAVSIDDPWWRDLLIRMADWKLDPNAYAALLKNPNYARLKATDQKAAELIEASMNYYTWGIFPPESVVPLKTMPPLVTNETLAEQESAASYPSAPRVDWTAFPGTAR